MSDDWELVHSYTADEAVEDGVLVEVPQRLAREVGFQWPVRISVGVDSLLTPSPAQEARGETRDGRLWDVLWMARVAIGIRKRLGVAEEWCIPFRLKLGQRVERLFACIDTTSGPAIHIIQPDEY